MLRGEEKPGTCPQLCPELLPFPSPPERFCAFPLSSPARGTELRALLRAKLWIWGPGLQQRSRSPCSFPLPSRERFFVKQILISRSQSERLTCGEP